MTWRREKLNDCVERRFFSGERLTVAQFRLKAGCVVQRHSHPPGADHCRVVSCYGYRLMHSSPSLGKAVRWLGG
jgi:hypothetical protein